MSVFIQLDEKTAITTDSVQWMLSKPHTRKDEVTWEGYAFFSTLEQCVNGYAQAGLRTSNSRTITQLSDCAERIATKLSHALSGLNMDISVSGRQPNTVKEAESWPLPNKSADLEGK